MLFPIADHYEVQKNLRKIHKGIVLSNDDPNKQGRVKVFVKGVLEGEIDSLPWCIQSATTGFGGSPGTIDFKVPEVGTEVKVRFLSESPYLPEYDGCWPSQGFGIQEAFGQDYPETYGAMDSTGWVERKNKKSGEYEWYHPSGFYARIKKDGTVDCSIPKDWNVRVDGNYSCSENFWSNGGGGVGSVLDEIGYAVLEGPYLQGVFDLVAELPPPMTVQDFSADLLSLNTFAKSLSTLGPGMADLGDVIKSVVYRDRIVKEFTVIGGVGGLSNIFSHFFGIFGTWTNSGIKGNEALLDSVINSLGSVSAMYEIFLGTEEAPKTEKETAAVISKVQVGLASIAIGAQCIAYFGGLQTFLSEWDGQWDPGTIIKALPAETNKFVKESVVSIFKALTIGTMGVDRRTQMVYLNRQVLSKYLQRSGQTADFLVGVTQALVDLGVDPYQLGIYGNVVKTCLDSYTFPGEGSSVRGLFVPSSGDPDPSKFELVRLVNVLFGNDSEVGGNFKVYTDQVMKFCDDLGMGDPMPPMPGGAADYSPWYLDYGTVIEVIKMLAVDLVGDADPQTPILDSGEKPDYTLSFCGGYVGAFARALAIKSDLKNELQEFAQEIKDWFIGTLQSDSQISYQGFKSGQLNFTEWNSGMTTRESLEILAGEMSRFVKDLDLASLFSAGASLGDIRTFFSEVLGQAPGRRVAPYGGNINQIIGSGFHTDESVKYYISNRIQELNTQYYANFGAPVLDSQGVDTGHVNAQSLEYFPMSSLYAAVFGSPHVQGVSGYDSLYHATHGMKALSDRMGRLGKSFKDYRTNYVNGYLASLANP